MFPMFDSSFIYNGLNVTNGTDTNQIVVSSGRVYFQNKPDDLDLFQSCTFTTVEKNSTYYLNAYADGKLTFNTNNVTKNGYVNIATVTTDANGNVSLITQNKNSENTNEFVDYLIEHGIVNRGRYTVDMLQEPFVIAHRGGSNLYPEDTLEAYRHIVAAGIRVIEAGDTQLLSDGALGIMHDTTIDRTTTGTGNVSDFDAYTFTNLSVDASSWLAPGASNTNPPLLEDCIRTFGASVIYVPESKDQKCAKQIAQLFALYGLQDNVIVQSASDTDLQNAVPFGVRTLLLSDSYDPVQAKSKGFTYMGVSTSATQSYIQSCVSAGIKPVVWIINKRIDWTNYQSWGCVGCFSDDPLYVSGLNTHIRTTDPFAHQTWYHGQFSSYGVRGQFNAPNQWGWANTSKDSRFVLQGWASPMPNAASSYTVTANITFSVLDADNTSWAGIGIGTTDAWADTSVSGVSNGYNIIVRQNGQIVIFRDDNSVSTQLTSVQTTAITAGQKITLQVAVTSTKITVTRTDIAAPNSCYANDTMYRGAYLFAGCNSHTGGATVWFDTMSVN